MGIKFNKGYTCMKRILSWLGLPVTCLVFTAYCLVLPVYAEAPSLQIPLDCDFNKTCWIQNHFDHNPGPGFSDYACGSLGYDGHDGIDFRLPNLAMMRQGVAVVAAAPGVVRAIRDEMPDISIRETGIEVIKGREAGNSVIIKHDNDWESQYSHLLLHSVKVKPGDRVRAGQILGLIGLSGKTEFPHLHFEIRYRGKSIDPFAGLNKSNHCGIGASPLWNTAALNVLTYQPTGILQAGFAPQRPLLKSVEQGNYSSLEFSRDVPGIVFWIEGFGLQAGDRELQQLFGPDGKLLATKQEAYARNKARWFSYTGKKRTGESWPVGEYRGKYQLVREREGQEPVTVINLERAMTIR